MNADFQDLKVLLFKKKRIATGLARMYTDKEISCYNKKIRFGVLGESVNISKNQLLIKNIINLGWVVG